MADLCEYLVPKSEGNQICQFNLTHEFTYPNITCVTDDDTGPFVRVMGCRDIREQFCPDDKTGRAQTPWLALLIAINVFFYIIFVCSFFLIWRRIKTTLNCLNTAIGDMRSQAEDVQGAINMNPVNPNGMNPVNPNGREEQ